MKRVIEVKALFAPIPGENPAGEDLRYSQTYEEIKKARRYDDPLEQGEWKTEVKKADWDGVVSLTTEAIAKRSKDLQIAAWLTEGLIFTAGFEGLATGLKVINGLLADFWDHVYPEIAEDDLEFRAAPLEFMNEKLSPGIRQIPVTGNTSAPGLSWMKWEESRQTGYEADPDENKRKGRSERIAEGRLTAEEFDNAAAASPTEFIKSLSDALSTCLDEFRKLDKLVDERFGNQAPRLAEFGKALEDCMDLLRNIGKAKGLEFSSAADSQPPVPSAPEETRGQPESAVAAPLSEVAPTTFVPMGRPGVLADADPWEQTLWEESLQAMTNLGIKPALEKLLQASLSSPSVREQHRYKFFIAKLCLRAERPELARPLLEQLYAKIEELHLDNWESPAWIAEVLGTVYRCLTSGEPADEDLTRANGIFQRLCTIDVTRALMYKK